MRFLISGASGFIGTYLTKFLRERGHTVIQLVRRQPLSADEAAWDPQAGVLNPSALDGIDVVVNLSGANLGAQRWTPQFKRELVDSRVLPTKLLAQTIARRPNPPVFISISAVGWYGHRGPDEELTEASDAGSGFIAQLARDWEAAAHIGGTGGPACPSPAGWQECLPHPKILHPRLGAVIGPEGMLAQLAPLFLKGLGGRLGSGKQVLSWIALNDIGPALLHCLEHGLTGPVNFTSPNPISNSEFAQQLAEQLHRPMLVTVPAFALRAAVGEMADELLSGQRVLPQRLLDTGYAFAYPNLREAVARYLPEL